MIRENISKLTFEDVKKELGQGSFYMHYDESDICRLVAHEESFNGCKESLLEKFGDVMMVVDKNVDHWSEKVHVEDAAFEQAQKEFCDKKAAWCRKYGCD